ncbi:MAG TPA: hypothetical protein VIP11_24000 [Gemmatimonadaceae bacterium]
MFGLLRALFFGALALIALIPIGILLVVVGLPVAAALGLLALPVLLVLFIVGLPILIIFAVLFGLLGATVGVVMAFLAFGAVALKIAVIILIPLLIFGWLARRMVGPPSDVHIRG